MHQTKTLALGGALLAVAVAAPVSSSAASGGGATSVTVRVEGVNKELLAPKTVTAPSSGSITKGGTPPGKCPAASATGALNAATRGHWGATYSSSVGQPEISSILGETHSFSSKYYWGVWVNNRYAQVGACELKLSRGAQLLFAAVPDKGPTPYPIALTAPAHAASGAAFKVKVVWFPATGASKPLGGAHVNGASTNAQGLATITARHAGTLVLRATKTGYIRAAAVRVSVS